ncbi:MAG: hypothetical protein WAP03_17605 [Methylorubrum rhodinum]|uniref:hypothetical protein n=1 Tax=Methylorubrum rhodinum TaxID=29428 RepID=UPI003BB1E11F
MVPLDGTFEVIQEVVYEDARAFWTTRMLDARETKLGPGRRFLGGIDRAHGLHRGLRADAGILGRLPARAEAQRRANQPRGARRAVGAGKSA